MSARIVVSCWMTHPGIVPAMGRGYLERARALTQRAEALGATLAAWGAVAVGFSFDADSLEEAISLATSLSDENLPDEIPWQCGIAEGIMEPLAKAGTRADLAWGEPLVSASTLARIAEPGDVLMDQSLNAYAMGELMARGSRVAFDRGKRVRGARLDTRQPWRSDAAAQVVRLKTPPMIGQKNPGKLLETPGSLAILRADPGTGGSRFIQELAALVAPGPCLVLQPSGSGLEPLGALRNALKRSFATELQQFEPEFESALHQLLSGQGVHVETAAALVAAFLRPLTDEAPRGALLIDDASDVDSATLDACARALLVEKSFACVIRLDATHAPPANLSALPHGPELELKPLLREDAEALAAACTDGALVPQGQKLWARRGACTPLGIVESIATGVASGELSWVGNTAYPRRSSAGKGKIWPASYWIARRAAGTGNAGQCILAVLTLLSGESSVVRIEQILAAAKVVIPVKETLAGLLKERWLTEPQPGFVALPTRTHKDAILGEFMDDATRRVIHRAIAEVLEKEECGLGLAEAAHHAGRSGAGEHAARLALAAAQVAMSFGLQHGATRLIAFARAEDPTCHEEARRQLAFSIPPAPSDSGLPRHNSEPPTMMLAGNAPPRFDSEPPSGVTIALPNAFEAARSQGRALSMPPLPPPMRQSIPPAPAEVGKRLTALAKEALLGTDTGLLERWTEGLLATGEHGRFAERMRAIVHLSRGDVGDALRVLRNTCAELEGNASSAERCQASLALGVALATAGRHDEALLEALDALARARETADETGAPACLALLAKLYASVSRDDESARLRVQLPS